MKRNVYVITASQSAFYWWCRNHVDGTFHPWRVYSIDSLQGVYREDVVVVSYPAGLRGDMLREVVENLPRRPE